jgi:shikimate kinase
MEKFTLVGLAGTGKSSISSHIAREEGLTVISTDAYFAEVRADLKHPVTLAYMENFKETKQQDYDVSILSSTADMIGRYGNDTFRDYEEQTIVWMHQSGMMKNAIPDLGGAAFMRKGTRLALKDAGVVSIYVDAPSDSIAANLLKDYEEYKVTRNSARGNYMQVAEQAEAKGESALEALKALSESHRAARVEHYRKADICVMLDNGDTIAMAAGKVRGALDGYALRQLSANTRKYANMGA